MQKKIDKYKSMEKAWGNILISLQISSLFVVMKGNARWQQQTFKDIRILYSMMQKSPG